MQRILLLSVLTLFLGLTISAHNGVQIISQDEKGMDIQFTFDQWSLQPVTINGAIYNYITAPNTYPQLSKGNPEVIKMSASIATPGSAPLTISIVNSQYTTLINTDIAPSKGSIKRSVDPAEIPFIFSGIYSQNTYYPASVAYLNKVYQVRDQYGQNLWVYPVQYNALTHTVKVYSQVTVHITYGSTLVTTMPAHPSVLFESIHQNHFINYPMATTANRSYTPITEEGSMLIICPSIYMRSMLPFVQWKRRSGIKVQMVDVASIGASYTAIKNYITAYYAVNDLTYVLLVGDALDIPPYPSYVGTSDNEYACIAGGDYYPDIIIGRFSADDSAEVQTQVQRSINYERDLTTSASFLNNGLCIASQYGPGNGVTAFNNWYDWQSERVIRDEQLHYTYKRVYELYDATHPADSIDTIDQDKPGNPTTADFLNKVDSGVGVINYTGHGNWNLIATTGMQNTNIPSLTNANMLPYCWIVGCQVGNFSSHTCFAEAGMWSTNNSNQPTGWLSMLGSTIDQYWAEPMCAQAQFDSILCHLKKFNRNSYGAISVCGEMAMNDYYNQTGDDMTLTWICFGDPSLMVRTRAPLQMIAHQATKVPFGTDTLTVWCNAEGAEVSLVQHDSILATGYVSGGKVLLSFNPILSIDSLYITATALNYTTYTGNATVIPLSGPYIAEQSFSLNDSTGNNNHLPDYGEHIWTNLSFENIGLSVAKGLHLSVNTTDTFVKHITMLKTYISSLTSSGTIVLNDAFSFDVKDSIPDGHNVTFSIIITDTTNTTYTSKFNITLLAPILSITSYEVADTTNSANTALHPGDGGYIKAYVTNSGHSAANIKISKAVCDNASVVLDPSVTTAMLLPSDTIGVKVPVSVTLGISNYAKVHFSITAADSLYTTSATWPYYMSRAEERFETDNFNLFKWVLSGNALWFTTTQQPYEGKYCAQSGHIGNSDTSTLSITVSCAQNDTLFFASKVSSEYTFDYLQFIVDTTLINEWSGFQDWTASAVPVTAGWHNFVWSYVKDPSNSSGEDCGWLDAIIFPANSATNTVDIYSNSYPLKINIMPNPASEQVDIYVTQQYVQPVVIKMFDINGHLINNTENNVGKYTWNVSGLSNGIYIIECISGTSIHYEKIVVQH